MDAFDLAKEYRDFVERTWAEGERGLRDLYPNFDHWAHEEEGDLIGLTGGDYTLGLLTWNVVVAWFYQWPEDFAAIRASVTVPITFTEWPSAELSHHLQMKLQGLPGILDSAEWQRQVFERMTSSSV